MIALKVEKIGDQIVMVLTEEALDVLDAKVGGVLHLEPTRDGVVCAVTQACPGLPRASAVFAHPRESSATPPSGVGSDFGRLKTAASPNEPSGSPPVEDSRAWAQSSIKKIPFSRQNSAMRCTSNAI